jgi:hypothetical protein
MLDFQTILGYVVAAGSILVSAGTLLIRYTVLVVSAIGLLTGVDQDTLAALPSLDIAWQLLFAGLAVFGYSKVKVAEMAQAERLIQETSRVANLSASSESARSTSRRVDHVGPPAHDVG